MNFYRDNYQVGHQIVTFRKYLHRTRSWGEMQVDLEQGSLVHRNRMVSLNRCRTGRISFPHGTNVSRGVRRSIPSRPHLLSHVATSARRSLRFLPWIVAASQTESATIPACGNRRNVVHAPVPYMRALDAMRRALGRSPNGRSNS